MRHEMASGESSKQRKYARPEKENRLAPVPRNQISRICVATTFAQSEATQVALNHRL